MVLPVTVTPLDEGSYPRGGISIPFSEGAPIRPTRVGLNALRQRHALAKGEGARALECLVGKSVHHECDMKDGEQGQVGAVVDQTPPGPNPKVDP